MSPIWGLVIAVLGVLIGLSWRFDWARSKDLAYFHRINSQQLWNGVDRLIGYIRWFGTKWTLLAFLGFVLLWRFHVGLSLTAAAMITVAIESGIKLLIKRPRPFVANPAAIVRQNPIPLDPSFPSGDATRVWFIFAALLMGLSPPLLIILIAGVTAAIVSYGRVRLGVHYPLDVWAGSVLGFGFGFAWTDFIS